ncbi:MAG: GNAT family N-acetyltransferase [Pseudomonadota bacterium]
MSMDQIIRDAHVDDIERLSDIAFRSKAHWGYSTQFMEACREELSVTAEKLGSDRYQYRVYESQRCVLGFYALEQLAVSEVELEALFVDPAYLGSGVGGRLLADAIVRAKDSGYSLMTILSDPNAENFYLKAGAERVGYQQSSSIPDRYLPRLQVELGSA